MGQISQNCSSSAGFPLASSPVQLHFLSDSLDMATTKRRHGRPASKPGHCSRHKRTIHSNEKEFNCDLCGKSLSRSDTLKRHRKIHLQTRQRGRPAGKPGQYQHGCGICFKTFQRRDHLARHKATVHSDKKNFKCDICGKRDSRLDNLRLHVKNVHQTDSKDEVSEGTDDNLLSSNSAQQPSDLGYDIAASGKRATGTEQSQASCTNLGV